MAGLFYVNFVTRMAITINQQPPEYSPVYNGLHFSLSSSNDALPNMTIQAVIKSGATTLFTGNYAKRPDGYFLIDAGRIVESQITPDITPINTGAGWQKSATFNKYTVELRESFSASPTGTPSPTGATTTVEQYAYNAALRYFSFNNYNQNQYLVDLSTLQNYLTYMPQSVEVRESQSIELGMFTEDVGIINPVHRAVITTYDVAGSVIQTATVNNPYNDYSVDANRFLSFICGPADLNSLSLDTGSQPLLNGGVYKYTVQMQDDDTNAVTTIAQEFIIDRRCSKYDPEIVLYFLNPLGRFDSFAFSLANQESYDFIRQQFTKDSGEVNESTGAFSFNQFGEQRVIFDTQEQPKWRLNADFLNENAAKWLRDLFGSPKVYMTHPDFEDALVEVTIAETSYTPPLRTTDRLFNVSVNVLLSAMNFRQRL